MSQATVPTSSARSSVPAGSSLHPQVKLALSYVDSSLEDELSRYRKARSGKQVTPSSVWVMQGSRKLASKADVELVRFVPIDQMPRQGAAGIETNDEIDGSGVERSTSVAGSQTLATDFLDQLAVIPEDIQEAAGELSSVSGSYSLSDLLDNSPIESFSLSTENYGAEDYLESSEELLRSLAQEEAEAEAERSGLENLITPFGIGSMLLMLMASGMFGYLVMNPATFASIGSTIGRLFSSSPIASNPVATPATGESGDVIPASNEFIDLSLNNLAVLGTQNAQAGLSKLPGFPLSLGKSDTSPAMPIAIGATPSANSKVSSTSNLASGNGATANEPSAGASAPGGGLFSGGNSSLGGGEMFKTPTSPAPQSTFSKPQRSEPRRSAPRKSSPVYQAPIYSPPSVRTMPVELPPAPSTPTSIPPAVIESAPSPNPGYRVEAPYTGDRALEKAQQAEPGAYFRNGENGAVVQMGGSYSTREEAEAKAQSLKKQGFDGVEVVK